jgi:DNA-binding response OmpR family regulator
MRKILVIENDLQTRKALRQTFAKTGFELSMVESFAAAVSVFNAELFAAIIMEPRLSGLSGQDFCREIRRRYLRVPIVVLSSAKAEIDKVILLELGADDYVTKPFNSRELLARVRAAVRRYHQEQSMDADHQSFGDVHVNFRSMEVFRRGVAVQLTSQEFKMLRFFLSNAERVIPEAELLEQVWVSRAHPGSRTVATHILRLRRKLELCPANPIHIRTVHGFGYKFVK